jgi:hypothetical protein
MLVVCGIRTKLTELDVDYSEYLGDDYLKLKKNIKTSTFISNHISWLDPVVF